MCEASTPWADHMAYVDAATWKCARYVQAEVVHATDTADGVPFRNVTERPAPTRYVCWKCCEPHHELCYHDYDDKGNLVLTNKWQNAARRTIPRKVSDKRLHYTLELIIRAATGDGRNSGADSHYRASHQQSLIKLGSRAD